MSRAPRLHHPELPTVGETVEIAGDDAHYLLRVLRLRPGGRFVLFGDGAAERVAAVTEILGSDRLVARIEESREHPSESPLRLALAVGLAKGAKLDLIVEKTTELGVTEILPFEGARSVVKLDARRAGERAERWRRIAREAARQSRRNVVPAIADPGDLGSVLARGTEFDRRILYWEEAERVEGPESEDAPRSVLLITGPEGGFTPEEAEAARRAGFEIRTLGPRVLRAETAAIVAVALAEARWGDLAR